MALQPMMTVLPKVNSGTVIPCALDVSVLCMNAEQAPASQSNGGQTNPAEIRVGVWSNAAE